jgi:hypothetical protein
LVEFHLKMAEQVDISIVQDARQSSPSKGKEPKKLAAAISSVK